LLPGVRGSNSAIAAGRPIHVSVIRVGSLISGTAKPSNIGHSMHALPYSSN
jgi:hypothetical protein